MKKFTKYPSKVAAATEPSSTAKIRVVLDVEMGKYDSSGGGGGDFEFSADTNDVGEVVLTPYDSNIHFTGVEVVGTK